MPQHKTNHEKERLSQAGLKRRSLLPKRFKRPSDPEQAKEWLRSVADHLSNFPNAGPSFRFVAYAIKKHLRNPKTSFLAHELGLVYPPGNPGNFQSRMNERVRGRTIVKLRDAGKPWGDICDAVGLQNKQSVKDLYKKYSALFPRERLQGRIDNDLKKFLKDPIR